MGPARLSMWHLGLPRQCSAADTTVRAARGFGVTAELASITPYDLPQQWAAAFAAAGHEGVRYRVRHDPGRQPGPRPVRRRRRAAVAPAAADTGPATAWPTRPAPGPAVPDWPTSAVSDCRLRINRAQVADPSGPGPGGLR